MPWIRVGRVPSMITMTTHDMDNSPPPSPRTQDTAPTRRSVVTAAGATVLAAGLTTAAVAPATALSPVAVPSAAPAATPPGIDPRAYATVARAIVVYDEHDKSLVPSY